jgi:dGTPase
MDWNTLLNNGRLSSSENVPPKSRDHRSEFQRDWDRIVFSTAFRRLHDKTQVFPLPTNDVVHSRLTHSLEVASVGRSLGQRSAQLIGLQDDAPQIVGDVVAASCLAHDIGNPPFGHAGEDAIRRYFGQSPVPGLSERQAADLSNYEGNAQGFRILSRLQFEDYGGMQLTAATLGAFLKYPRESGKDLEPGYAGSKKFGVFQNEVSLLRNLAQTLNLPQLGEDGQNAWRRHPLAYLVEAADDICNSILDLEDACRLGWVAHKTVNERLKDIAGDRYSAATFALYQDPQEGTGYLRAISIGVLVESCAELFEAHATSLLKGNPVKPLVKLCRHRDNLAALNDLAKTGCYENPSVLEREAAGYSALIGLLQYFVPSLIIKERSSGSFESRMLEFLQRRSLVNRAEVTNVYDRILRVLDYISGMTDSYAIESFRRLSGVTT